MSGSLRDQLLALGLGKNSPPEAPRDERARRDNRDGQRGEPRRDARDGNRGGGKPVDARRDNRNAKPGDGRPANRDGQRPGGRPDHPRDGQRRGPRPNAEATKAPRPPRVDGEPDLAQAYAARARTERDEREQAERAAAEVARARKERKEKLGKLLEGQAQNAADADQPRHFPHGEKIRRVYVTAAQLLQLNAGQLGVVQWNGRYVLVTRDIALAAQAIQPEALALLPDPDAPADDDVPADLVW